MKTKPFTLVGLSAATYGVLLTFLQRRGTRPDSARLRGLIKSISALHATATTVLVLISLNQQWIIPPEQTEKPARLGPTGLDDSKNPTIAGRNDLADAITAWETGYLIYDSVALYTEAYATDPSKGSRIALMRLLRSSPVFVIHHASLAIALLFLQSFIAMGRERGVWVIVAFFCMNASNPLVHLRWWHFKQTGKQNKAIDALLVLGFALCRFGTVYWVLMKYGRFHGLSPLDALNRQRLQCKVGTGLLTGTNFVWWLALLKQMTRKRKH